jgi:hypothetical protein
MRGRRAGILLLLCLAAETLCAQSELWDKAAALADRGKVLLPGTMRSLMEELNEDGSVRSSMELLLQYSYDADGKMLGTEVVRAVRDGKDVTEETRKGMSRQGSRPAGMFGVNGMIFGEDARRRTRLLPGASWAELGGRKTGLVPFEIGMEKGNGTMTGTAEIDAETGIPSVVRAVASLSFVNDLSFTMAYAGFPSHGFALTRMDFSGAMSFLGMKRRFRASMELGGYRAYAVPR